MYNKILDKVIDTVNDLKEQYNSITVLQQMYLQLNDKEQDYIFTQLENLCNTHKSTTIDNFVKDNIKNDIMSEVKVRTNNIDDINFSKNVDIYLENKEQQPINVTSINVNTMNKSEQKDIQYKENIEEVEEVEQEPLYTKDEIETLNDFDKAIEETKIENQLKNNKIDNEQHESDESDGESDAKLKKPIYWNNWNIERYTNIIGLNNYFRINDIVTKQDKVKILNNIVEKSKEFNSLKYSQMHKIEVEFCVDNFKPKGLHNGYARKLKIAAIKLRYLNG